MLSPKQLPRMIRGAKKQLYRARVALNLELVEVCLGGKRADRRRLGAAKRAQEEATMQLGELIHLRAEYELHGCLKPTHSGRFRA